jgi:hypothetical protein
MCLLTRFKLFARKTMNVSKEQLILLLTVSEECLNLNIICFKALIHLTHATTQWMEDPISK